MPSGTLFLQPDTEESYLQRLPWYLIARCPLCGAEYRSVADTHGLYEWDNYSSYYQEVFSYEHQSIGCDHFIGVHTFVNLNGNFPTETYDSGSTLDVPRITPELLLDEYGTGAVIHSLPICRLQGEEFVPTYSVYTLTYFAEQPRVVYKKALNILYPPEPIKPGDDFDPGELWTNWSRLHPEEVCRDLPYWVERGKLHWLDLDQADLPLQSASVSEFPYANIQGFGRRYAYIKRRKPKAEWWYRIWTPPRDRYWHPDGIISESVTDELLAYPDW